jgi:hypothetical protein
MAPSRLRMPQQGMAQLYEASLQGRRSVALSTRMQSIECEWPEDGMYGARPARRTMICCA